MLQEAYEVLRPLRRTFSLPNFGSSGLSRHLPPALCTAFEPRLHPHASTGCRDDAQERRSSKAWGAATPVTASTVRSSSPSATSEAIASSVEETAFSRSTSPGRTAKEVPSHSVSTDAPTKPCSGNLWLLDYRDCTGWVPSGVQAFIDDPPPSAEASQRRNVPRKNYRVTPVSPESSRDLSTTFSSMTDSNSRFRSGSPILRDGLHRIEQWGETHTATSIPLSRVGERRRGLFGAAKDKTLDQMVLATLNKVSTDREKFKDVKVELLNLPLPEASDEVLQKVIQVFLRKAILEPKFSHLYAELMRHLCIQVPPPPGKEGKPFSDAPPASSLEVRVGREVVELCREKFRALVKSTQSPLGPASSVETPNDSANQSENSPLSEEEMKDNRNKLCGTVRFAVELHKISFISDSDLSEIILTCCTGAIGGQISTPPTYEPSEAQMSALITFIGSDTPYFKSAEWKRLVIVLEPWLSFWETRYPISRIRFLLISTHEKVQRFLPPVVVKNPRKAVEKPTSVPSAVAVSTATNAISLAGAVDRVPSIMNLCSSGSLSLEELASGLVTQCPHQITPFVLLWISRSLQVIRESWAREHAGTLLGLLLSKAETVGEKLDPASLSSEIQKLIEDLFNDETHLQLPMFFRFFAVVVLSDELGTIMSADWLNLGIAWVMKIPSETIPLDSYLASVCEVHIQRVSHSGSCLPSTLTSSPIDSLKLPEHPLYSFHPLLMMFSLEEESPSSMEAWLKMQLEARNKVISHSTELYVFETLRNAVEVEPAVDRLFEHVCNSPMLLSNTSLAASVIIGILAAEHYGEARDFLSPCARVLQVAVDQPNRRDSERYVVKAVHRMARYLSEARVSIYHRVMHELVTEEVISQETFDVWVDTVREMIPFKADGQDRLYLPSWTKSRDYEETPSTNSPRGLFVSGLSSTGEEPMSNRHTDPSPAGLRGRSSPPNPVGVSGGYPPLRPYPPQEYGDGSASLAVQPAANGLGNTPYVPPGAGGSAAPLMGRENPDARRFSPMSQPWYPQGKRKPLEGQGWGEQGYH